MKLPTNSVSLIKLMDRVLSANGFPKQYIAKVKRDKEAYRKWYKSDQQFIEVDSFATGGGVKAPCGTAVKRPGVYKYTNKITGECVYVGRSDNLNERTTKGKAVFKSINETGAPPSQTIYPGVEKMFDEDSIPENWIVSYMETFSTTIAKEEEDRIIHEESPRFNDKKMAGK